MTSPRILLRAWSLQPKKQLGQNFLSHPSTAEMIVRRSAIGPEDTVLEIGAGLGALTLPAARAAEKIYAIEKDREIMSLLRTELLAHHIENVELLEQDVLKIDLPSLLKAQSRPIVVIGNLPYNISSQVLVRLIHNRSMVKRAVLMFQKELADRLMAGPNSRDYGRLTVMLGYCAEIRPVAHIEANLFFPRPKIDSTVLEITFRTEQRVGAPDERFLFRVIKAAFGQRRKTLKNALTGGNLGLTADRIHRSLAEAGIDPKRRAESLTVEEFVGLSHRLESALADEG